MGLGLNGCAMSQPDAPLRPQLIDQTGQCWGKDVTPARFETVTEQILVQPAQIASDGTIMEPAAYRTITEQRITAERREIEFATPCPDQLTPEFIAALQRALTARGLYAGRADGVLDRKTGAAVRAFQRPFGIDSAILSLEAAQRLGLIALTAAQIEFANNSGLSDPFIAPLQLID